MNDEIRSTTLFFLERNRWNPILIEHIPEVFLYHNVIAINDKVIKLLFMKGIIIMCFRKETSLELVHFK